MPELPEVETVRRGLVPHAVGKTIGQLTLHRPDLRTVIPKELPKKMGGKKVEAIERHGKTLIWRIAGVPPVAWHLGMSGSFRIETEAYAARKHDHVVLSLKNGPDIVFNDPRRFGSLGYAKNELAGLDPLDGGFTAGALADLLKGRKAPIKSALLDQRLVTGIGNIYACEALWQAKIHPMRETGTLGKKETDGLYNALEDVLARAIKSGGSSLRDHISVDGELGYFQHHFAVYGRKGQKCERCRTSVEISRIAGRSTFFCPKCQSL